MILSETQIPGPGESHRRFDQPGGQSGGGRRRFVPAIMSKRARAKLPASFYEQLEANKRLNFGSASNEWRKSYSAFDGVQHLTNTEKAKAKLTAQTAPTISPVHNLQTELVPRSNDLDQATSVIKVSLSSMQYNYP